MFLYYNAHPKELNVDDCVKRALCVAQNTDYMIVQKELNDLKKVTGSKSYNSNKNWKKYVELKGWRKLSFPAEAGVPRMNGERFSDEYTTGTYILRMAHHLTVCKDGVIYDTWDCSQKCVYNAWEVK